MFFIMSLNTKAFAQTQCQPIYGGGQTCTIVNNLVIDKKVLNPKTNQLVDNLGVNDPKYQSGFLLNFQITLTNTGSVPLDNVLVRDIFPQFTTFSSGAGNFDQNTRTLTFTVNNLLPQETRSFFVLGRIVDENQLPSDFQVSCLVNQVSASFNNLTSQDSSQFCIEKKLVPTTKGGFPVLSPVPVTGAPSTGPEALILFSLIPTLGAGIFLRKIARKN